MTRMVDGHKRTIDYLRVSITDRCNLRCLYCMPSNGVRPVGPSEILSYEEIIRLVKVFIGMGVRFVRLTGGEPLVRKNLLHLIKKIKAIPGLESLSLTTNGILLGPLAADLKNAGLDRVNVSLDTLDGQRYREITRGGNLKSVLDGLAEAYRVELRPVKINTVVIRGFNHDEIPDMARLTLKQPYHLRFIEFMPLGARDYWSPERYYPLEEIRRRVEEIAPLVPVENPVTAGPAEKFRFPEAPGQIGFISPVSNHFCHHCNRLRLTSEGQLRLCLFSLEGIDLRTPLREGINDIDLEQLIQKAIEKKPDRRRLEEIDDRLKTMYRIGG